MENKEDIYSDLFKKLYKNKDFDNFISSLYIFLQKHDLPYKISENK